MNRRVLLTLALLLPTLALAQVKINPADVIEYEPVVPPMETSTGADGVEVIELFWYGCPHCYRLEPYIERWLEQKPDHVTYVRIPAIFPNRQTWENHARTFYAAEALGVIDKVHRPFFDAIHAQRRKLNDEDAIAAFFVELGIDEAEFRKAYGSFAVDGKVRRAAQLTRRYAPDDLLGRTLLAVVNFPPRRIAGFKSECLVLGVVDPNDPGDVVLVAPDAADTQGWELG